MFLELRRKKMVYSRKSKTGKDHEYYRWQSVAVFRCDNCDDLFERNLKQIHSKRLSNNYFHVCPNCDSKRFGQKRAVEKKKIWDMPASLDLPVSKF
jgi:DNA-directed RNA polymerase subunit RPC12/RpoP